MTSVIAYRTHRHRKEVLATRRIVSSIGKLVIYSLDLLVLLAHTCLFPATQSTVTKTIKHLNMRKYSKVAFFAMLLNFLPVRTVQSSCISQCTCMWKGGKETVECIEAKLTHVPRSLSPLTQVLNLRGNNIRVLKDRQFVQLNLTNLQKIHMKRCQLKRIEAEAFVNVQNLVHLDLSENLLSAVPVSALRYPTSLRRLLLNNNPIKSLEAGSFSQLAVLSELELRNCQIETVSDWAFRGLDNLKFLKLNGNRIQTIRGVALVPMTSIHSLDLYDNSWNCDCNLKTFIEVLVQRNTSLNVQPDCMGPPRLFKKQWDRVSLEEFACEPSVLNSSPTYQESIVEGSNITLECHIVADPTPSLVWMHRGQIITNRTEIGSSGEFYLVSDMGTVDKTSTLFIPFLRLQDSGRYACVAENIAGKAFRNFTLLVLSHTVEVETIVNKDKPPPKVVQPLPQGLIIAIGLGIGVLVLLILVLLLTCLRRQRHARNNTKPVRQSNNTIYKHSNSSNHLPSVTTEANLVCEGHDITLLDVIKTKPLPRLGPYECIPTTDIDTFDIIPNKGQHGPVNSTLPAYVAQPGTQNTVQNVNMWGGYQQVPPTDSSGSPLGLGVLYHRSKPPHQYIDSTVIPARHFDSPSIKCQPSDGSGTLRRNGSKIRAPSVPIGPVLDQRERGDGSSEQSNATTEFPDNKSAEKSADKRRHRQSWESMINRNSGCINEDPQWPQGVPLPSVSTDHPHPYAKGQPDSIQPYTKGILKRDTEV